MGAQQPSVHRYFAQDARRYIENAAEALQEPDEVGLSKAYLSLRSLKRDAQRYECTVVVDFAQAVERLIALVRFAKRPWTEERRALTMSALRQGQSKVDSWIQGEVDAGYAELLTRLLHAAAEAGHMAYPFNPFPAALDPRRRSDRWPQHGRLEPATKAIQSINDASLEGLHSEARALCHKIYELSHTNGALRSILYDAQNLFLHCGKLRNIAIETYFEHLRPSIESTLARHQKPTRLFMDAAGIHIDRKALEAAAECIAHFLWAVIEESLDPSEERAAAGKANPGCLVLSSRRQNGTIVLSIRDDGRGLSEPTLEELLHSARQELTSVAGHVRCQRGDGFAVDLIFQDKETMANLLQFRLGQSRFAIPADAVSTLAELPHRAGKDEEGPTVQLDQESIRVVSLEPSSCLNKTALVVKQGDKKVALAADELLGIDLHTVYPIAPPFHREHACGTFDSSEGELVVVLDPISLVKRRIHVA